MHEFEAYLTDFREQLLEAWPAVLRQASDLVATITLALRFSTWETLNAQGLGDKAMAVLVYQWLEGGKRTERGEDPVDQEGE